MRSDSPLDAQMQELAGRLQAVERKLQQLRESGAERTRGGRAEIAAVRAERAELGREMARLGLQRAQDALEGIPWATTVATSTAAPSAPPMSSGVPPEAMEIGIGFATCTVATLVLLPLSRALERRMERRASAPAVVAGDVRLTRFEQRIDSLAIELERIGEAQRYATKVLTEPGRR